MDLDELYTLYGSGLSGLSSEKVMQNEDEYGKNTIEEKKKKAGWRVFLDQFRDYLVIVLIVAALISAFTGDIQSFAVIIAVITLNAILGTVQTLNAEKSLAKLKSMTSPSARVIREDKICTISASEVVVGDIVLLRLGDQIPADGRVIECDDLQTNESALTGESTSVEKYADTLLEKTPLADRHNMVYSGGYVVGGSGKILITDVGMCTEVGRIAKLISTAEERKTPLQRNLDRFSKSLSLGVMVICLIVFVLSLIRSLPLDFSTVFDALIFAIALAVAAVPEALSSIVTILLSMGTQKMARENAIVRKLQAVEGLGSVSVICSDKTGTLTCNQMTVRNVVVGNEILEASAIHIDKRDHLELLLAAVLCNDAVYQNGVELGDPTETALLRFAEDCGITYTEVREKMTRFDQIPFDSRRKMMTVCVEYQGKKCLYVKGAADVLLDRMSLDIGEREHILEQVATLTSRGLRVLCFAEKEFYGENISEDDESSLCYLGLIAQMDPPRPESYDAVAQCKLAGIKPVMITGDHIVTASAIAQEIGILEHDNEAVEGKELDKYTDEQLIDFVADKSVYARVTPEHKLRIVKAWQRRNKIVAMTGDGVNDAPALQQADVGVAMGDSEAQATKDAADIILTDNNFATIVRAVANGRSLYENIIKSILYLLSGNLAAILVVLYCSLAGLPVPFSPIHLLFINLLADSLPAIGLGLEPYCGDVMKKKPRAADASILTRDFLIQTGYQGLILSIAVMIAFLLGYIYAGENNSSVAMTMAFATLCMSRLLQGFSCKSDKPVIFTRRFWNNGFLFMAFFAGMALLHLVLYIPPLHGIFQVADDTSGTLLFLCYVCSFGSFFVVQAVKAIIAHFRK